MHSESVLSFRFICVLIAPRKKIDVVLHKFISNCYKQMVGCKKVFLRYTYIIVYLYILLKRLTFPLKNDAYRDLWASRDLLNS
jgi:hypothetical protein